MGMAFIPLYIKFLGIEAYGLIGLFAVLQAWLSLLDMGMTPTISREIARFTGGSHSAKYVRDLLRSIEIITVCMGALAAFAIWAASEWIAGEWLRSENLPKEVVARAISIMGLIAGLRALEGVYRSAMLGFQRHVLYNIINSLLATLRGLGAVVILIWSPTIDAFFGWQGFISVLAIVVFGAFIYQAMEMTTQGIRVSMRALYGIREFAGGMIGITILTILLTQVDKILLSKLIPLSEFGYYTVAAVVAGTLTMLVAPIAQAFYPQFTELHAADCQVELIKNYHIGGQLVSVTTGSAAIVLIVFADSIILIWSGDTKLASSSGELLKILAFGNLLNALMWIPYHTQLAYGWTGLAFRTNLISVVVIAPAILWVTPLYGAVGAAYVWVLLNTGYLLVSIQFMHRHILIGEKWKWYIQDVILPILPAFLVGSLVGWVIPTTAEISIKLAWIFFAGLLTITTSVLFASRIRTVLVEKMFNYK